MASKRWLFSIETWQGEKREQVLWAQSQEAALGTCLRRAWVRRLIAENLGKPVEINVEGLLTLRS